MDKKFTYGISGAEDEKSLLNSLKKIAGVKQCGIEDGKLFYVLDEHTDEYHVLLEANELCAKFGAALIIGDDDDDSQDESAAETENVTEAVRQTEETDEHDEEAPAAKSSVRSIFDDEEDYSSVDKIVYKRKKVRNEMIVRAVELCASAILLLVCFFISGSETGFGAKSLLSVLAFALGGYEIFYAAIADVAHKKFLSENAILTLIAIAGALLGYVFPTTSLIIAFSIAKAVESLAAYRAEGMLDETFYTGSVDVTLADGREAGVENIAVGDVIKLSELDVLPCDGIALDDMKIDAYVPLGVPELTVEKGETVYAGSVLLSASAEVETTATNADSKVNLEKKKFTEKLEKASEVPFAVKAVNAAVIILSLAAAFAIPALIGGDYMTGLRLWGSRAIAVMAAATLVYGWTMGLNCVKNAMTVARSARVDFASARSLETFASADDFEFLSSTLTENGAVKPDVYGSMNELMSLGVKNVSVDFDEKVTDDVKSKLTFKQNAVKGEKKVVVGKDVTFGSGGKVDVLNGEIVFVPYAYRLAKRAVGWKKAVIVVKIIATALLIAGAFVFDAAAFCPVYFGAISGLIASLSAVSLLITTKKSN